MRISDLGEFRLIESISRMSQRKGAFVSLGIGDDAAVLRLPQGRECVVSVDAFIEGVHFRLDQESPYKVGSRALLASLSDLAAMGAEPMGATLAAGLPTSLDVKTAKLRSCGVAELQKCGLAGTCSCRRLPGNCRLASLLQSVATVMRTRNEAMKMPLFLILWKTLKTTLYYIGCSLFKN